MRKLKIYLEAFKMTYSIAIIGATGAVGHKLLSTIINRKFPTNEIYL